MPDTQIELREVTWDQVTTSMSYVEHQSPKYRILQIDSLQISTSALWPFYETQGLLV